MGVRFTTKLPHSSGLSTAFVYGRAAQPDYGFRTGRRNGPQWRTLAGNRTSRTFRNRSEFYRWLNTYKSRRRCLPITTRFVLPLLSHLLAQPDFSSTVFGSRTVTPAMHG